MNKIMFLFPSHNVAYDQMGMALYDNYSEVKDLFLAANQEYSCKFEDIIFFTENCDQSMLELKIPAVFLTSVAFHRVLENVFQIEPDYYFGNGVGKLAALVCAKVIEFEDAIHYLHLVTNYIAKQGIKDETQITDAQRKYFVELFEFVPVRTEEAKKKVIQQLEDIAWDDIDFFVDVGPSRECGGMVKKSKPQARILYLDLEGDAYFPLSIFQARKLQNYNFLLDKMLGAAVSGKNKNYDEQSYKNGVLKPYESLKALCEKYHGTQTAPSKDEIKQAAGYLTSIMENKGMDPVEIAERLNRLESETLICLQ